MVTFAWMLSKLFSLFFPRLCVVCGKSLIDAEKLLCIGCISDLPRSGYWLREENIITQLFSKFPTTKIEHASSFLYYTKESPYHQLLLQLKYHGAKEIGIELGKWFGAELLQSPFYKTVDAIIPVPLHPKKERKRGYNQSEVFAEGLSLATGWSLETEAIKRTRYTATQTKLNREERQKNVTGAFELYKTEQILGKHLLLVDDVLTTGATLQTCAKELLNVPECKVSIATVTYIE